VEQKCYTLYTLYIHMPTDKKRINISVTDDIEEAIKLLAKRDNVPVATKANDLIRMAIELDEDDILREIAEKRDTKDASYVSHEDAWSWRISYNITNTL